MAGALARKMMRINTLLEGQYGSKTPRTEKDPLTELIFTMLSQNTSDTNRDRAFASLRRQFPSWKDVASASATRVAKSIEVGGLSRIKASRILKLLRHVEKSCGELSLDFLTNWPDEQIERYLSGLEGVGPKTIACVLVFSLGRNVMPVDTHVRRVSTRLGILPEKLSDYAAHEYFLRFRDQLSLFQLHLNLIGHGRKTCRARKPLCQQCVIRRLCNYYAEVTGPRRSAA